MNQTESKKPVQSSRTTVESYRTEFKVKTLMLLPASGLRLLASAFRFPTFGVGLLTSREGAHLCAPTGDFRLFPLTPDT
jgi:hypothetical protein